MTNEQIIKTISRIADLIDSVCSELLEVQVGSDPIVMSSAAGLEQSKRFSEIDSEPHIPQYDLIISMINSAILLTRKISMGSIKGEDGPLITPVGAATLTVDINEINANGDSIHRISYDLIEEYGDKSAKAESIKVLYSAAMELYSGLQREIPKLAITRGRLPAVNLLKPLSMKP